MTVSETIQNRAFRRAWENIYVDALSEGMEPSDAEAVADAAILHVTTLHMKGEKNDEPRDV